MRKGWYTAVETALVQMLRRPGYLMALVLCPVIIFVGSLLLPAEDGKTEITAGVAFEAADETAEKLFDLLEEESGEMITFCLAEEEEVKQRVAAGQWECGYLFSSGLEEGLISGDRSGLVTLVCTEGTMLQMPVTEMVSAALLELVWDEIGEEQLSGLGLYQEINEPLKAVLPEEDWVAIQITAVGGSEGQQEPSPDGFYESLLSGIIGLWLFVAALLAGGELAEWLKRPYTRYALPGTGLWPMLLPKCVVLSLTAFVSGLASLLAAGGDRQAFLALGLYELTLTVLSLAIALLPGIEKLLPVLLPVMPLLSVVASPLLVDVSRFLPALRPVSACLPLTGYLRFVREGQPRLLLVQLAGLSVLALILALFRKGKRAQA